MRINKYIGLAICSYFMAACQNDGLEVKQPLDSEKHTLIGQIMNNDSKSRAQIELGCQAAVEYFFWNEGDNFTLYQHVNDELVSGIFEISEDYNETNGGTQNAEFSSSTALNKSTGYTALYPSPATVSDNKVRLEVQKGVDFSAATTEAEIAEVWKRYFNNNMFMVASGTLSESGRNYIQFNHLCALARISYVNQTGSMQQINAVRLNGQNLGFYMNYNLKENKEEGSGSYTDYRFPTTGLTVADKDTADIYILFFPKKIEQTDLQISIQQSSGNKTLTLPWKDILAANGNNESFLPGMRYWFDVTDTEGGLEWSKNLATDDWIVFENPELSKALHSALGSYKVLMTEEGYAKITEQHVNSINELDFSSACKSLSSLAGIEVFRNLQTLKCSNLGLEMDMCDLSMYGSLKYVDLSSNNVKALKLPADTWSLNYLDCHENLISSLDITAVKGLQDSNSTLICGSQKNDISLNLIMNNEQKNNWESLWVNHEWNENVTYEGMSQETEMKLVAKNGGSFTVTEKLRLTSPLIVESDFTLTFDNGAFWGDEGQFVDTQGWKAMVVVMPGATFTFNGGGEYNTGHKETQLSCIRMVGGSNAPSKVIMNNGNLIGTYHAILIDEDCQNAEVVINGGSLSCDWWGNFKGVTIFNKSNAKITVNGGSFRSPLGDGVSVSSIETWGGELNITGGQFEASMTSVQEGLNVNPKVGNTLIGPAIAIAPKREVTVNISGGNFTGNGSSSFLEKIVDSSLLGKINVNLSITGGTFNAPVTSQDCQSFISGGQFKVQPKDIYLAEGKSVVQDGDYWVLQNGVATEASGFLAVVSKVYPDLVSKNADGTYTINQSKAVEVVELALSGQGTFESLDGIENFPNLERLFCDRVGLKTLDISKNQKLKQVEIRENLLTSLNFSNNPALEIIKCNGQQDGMLASLDVTGNINLRVLECQNNTLTSLDLTHNTNLEEIDCGVNKLSSLNVANNLKLRKFFLACNDLTELDLSKHLDLEQLHCTENHISTLDITKNSKLNWLNCGNQQPDGTMITLILTRSQKELWDSEWSKIEYWNSRNVELVVLENGSGTGLDFDIKEF